MIITVGSKNPNKLNAVKEAFFMFPPFESAKFNSLPSPSNVSDQPIGFDETVKGALNRSINAFDQCRYSVGLESGLVPVPYTHTGYMNISVCVIYDGKNHYTGTGPAFELPETITRLIIDNNLELDDAIVQSGLSTNPRIGYSEGIIGILTNGVVTRKDYMVPAVTMALAQILHTLPSTTDH